MSGRTLDAFREEMRRRGVYERNAPRGRTLAEKRRREYTMEDFRAEARPAPAKLRPRAGAARRAFFGAIVQSARARLALLDDRLSTDLALCPWLYLGPHDESCRCRGVGRIAVGTLRLHCRWLIAEYARFA